MLLLILRFDFTVSAMGTQEWILYPLCPAEFAVG